jgi:hypothetical protein
MSEEATVTRPPDRTVSVASIARTSSSGRAYLFAFAARAFVIGAEGRGFFATRRSVVFSDTVRRRASRADALASVAAGAGLVARRLGVVWLGRQSIVQMLVGARRSGVAAVSAFRSIFPGLVARRPEYLTASGLRSALANYARRRVASGPVSAPRTVAVEPRTSVDTFASTLEDSSGAQFTDSSGGTLVGQVVTFTTSYLRRRVLRFAPAVGRTITATNLALRGLFAPFRPARALDPMMRRIRFGAVDVLPSPAVQRHSGRLDVWRILQLNPAVGRTITATNLRTSFISALFAARSTISGTPFKLSPITDSSGNAITDHLSVPLTAHL